MVTLIDLVVQSKLSISAFKLDSGSAFNYYDEELYILVTIMLYSVNLCF